MLKGPTESTETVSLITTLHSTSLPFARFPFKPLQCPSLPSNHNDTTHLPTNITVNVIPSSETDVVAPDHLSGFIQNSLDSVGASAIDPIIASLKGKRRGRKPKIVVAEEDKEAVAKIGRVLERENGLALDDICALTGIEGDTAKRLLTSTPYFVKLVNFYWILSPDLTLSQLKTLRGLSKASTCTMRTLKQRVSVEVNRLEAVYAESSTGCFENWNGVLVVDQDLLEWKGCRRGWVEETFELEPIKDPCDSSVLDVGSLSLADTFI